MPSKRIFLSAASDEYGDLRVKLAAKLQRSGINVEHQGIFPQTPSDTVRKLGDLIRGCPLLVHIVGHHPGSIAAPAAVADLLNEIPSEEFLVKLPNLRRALGDLSGITYTQWEAFLALHLGVEVLLYAPCDVCESGTKALKSDSPQKHHLDRLFLARKHPDFCADEADFIGNILADVYRHFGLPESGLPAVTPSYLPERNRHFRGRKADLARLGDALSQSTTIGITQQVAVFASGGVGKSSLALEFAWDCFASRPPKYPGGVFWCDCRGRDVASLAEGLANFAGMLGIEADEHTDPLSTARQVRNRLVLGPPSLLVLDNVVDSEQWKIKEWNELLPGGNCHRLLTTRAENLGDHRIPMVRLDRLSVADARALLHAYRGDVSLEDKDDAVRAIVNWFGGLAIGLTVVGIYLGINSTLSWDAYWKSLREKKLDAVRGTEDLAAPADYSSRVDAVIDDLFGSQSQPEQQALLYASVLPGDDVSDRWLIELLTDDLVAGKIRGNTPPGYPSFPHAVIAKLTLRGILVRSIDTPTRKALFLHQVIRERFRELLQLDTIRSRHVSAHSREFAVKNYHRSRQWTQAMVEATDFSEAKRLLASMGEANFEPDVFTFTTLLSKADTYAAAKQVVAQMVAAKCEPNVFTFTTLLSKADTYAAAKEVVAQMVTAKCEPNVKTLSALFSKVAGLPPIGEILSWYYAIPFHPSDPLNALIGGLKKLNRLDEAMRIVLEHPHLSAGQRLMRDFPESAQAFFQSAKAEDSSHPTADLALGILAMETNKPDDARAYLEEALRRAIHPLQVKTIRSKLKSLA